MPEAPPKNIKEEYGREFEEMCKSPSSSERYDDDLTAIEISENTDNNTPKTRIDETLFNSVVGDGTRFNQPGYIDTVLDDIINNIFADTDAVEKTSRNCSEPILFSCRGKKHETTLARPFTVTAKTISISMINDDDRTEEYEVDQLDFICLNTPLFGNKAVEPTPELVETFSGLSGQFHVLPGAADARGICCVDHFLDRRFRFLFIPLSNIKNRCLLKPIGEILLDHNLIDRDILLRALARQKKMRKMKFGQILEKKARLQPGTVEKILNKSVGRELIGQMMVRAGMITEKEVEETLRLQKSLRNKKVGDILLKEGVISEDELYATLAEKFRRSFVNLYDVFICKKTGNFLPCDLIKKLRILPLSKVGNRLLLATSHPEISKVTDILHRKLKCPLEIFVTTESQIKSAITRKCEEK